MMGSITDLLTRFVIPIYIAAPLALMALLCWRATAPPEEATAPGVVDRRLPLLLLLFCAFVAATGVFLTGASKRTWPESSEIAWTGASSAGPGAPLRIGGPRQGATLGWPSGAFSPSLSVVVPGDAPARWEVDGHGALVQVDGRFVNGAPLSVGSAPLRVADVEIQLLRKFLVLRRLRLSDPVTGRSADIRLPDTFWLKADSRVRSLLPRLGAEINDLRASRDPAAQAWALRLEEWARDARYVRESGSAVRIAHPDLPASRFEARLPASLTVRWPDRTLRGTVRSTNGVIHLGFEPPWTLASPLPPVDAQGGTGRSFVVTGAVEPGDIAFPLPLGDQLARLRTDIPLTALPMGGTAFASSTPPPPRERPDEASEKLIGVPRSPRSAPAGPAFEGSRSAVEVGLGEHRVQLEIVENLPKSGRLGVALLLALALLGIAAWWAGDSLWPSDFWVLCGLLAALWDLLLLRLLLAIRYVLDPRHLDLLSVSGLTSSTAALFLGPTAVVLVTRLWRDRFLPSGEDRRARRAFRQGFAIWVAAAGGAVLAHRLALASLPNVPSHLRPDQLSGTSAVVASLWLLLGLAWCGLKLYDTSERKGTIFWPFLAILQLPERLLFHWGPGYVVPLLSRSSIRRPTRGSAGGAGVPTWTVGLALALLLSGFFWLFAMNFTKDVLVPFFVGGSAAVLWLAVASREADATDRWTGRRWLETAVASTVLLALPTFVLPVVLKDVGGVFAAIAFVLPLTVVVASSKSTWRSGLVGLATFSILLVAAYNAFFTVATVVPGSFERGRARIVVNREGLGAQRLLPLTEMAGHDGPAAVTFESLRNAIEHTWENKALAHLGGLTGAGFGKAPDRQSRVRHDTLQFDSAYSFFVAGDHGLVGGLSLLSVYGLALVCVLAGARSRFHPGQALAATILASLLAEAMIHVCMDLGGLPFTGRNLPFLSVNSATDLIRGLLLFCVAAQARLWGASGAEGTWDPVRSRPLVPEGPGPATTNPIRALFEKLVRRGPAIGLLGASAIAMLLLVLRPAMEVLGNPGYGGTFTWDVLIGEVKSMIRSGKLHAEDGRILIRQDEGDPVWSGRSLLEMEIKRFNALPPSERFPDSSPLARTLAAASSLGTYDAAIGSLRTEETGRTPRRPLLVVLERARPADLDEDADGSPLSGPQYVPAVNPDFNIQIQFTHASSRADLPTWTFRREEGTPAATLLGPAWVAGEWRLVVSPTAPLSWAGDLARELRGERKKGEGPLGKGNGELSLDASFQRSAQALLATRGRQLHADHLRLNTRRQDLEEALPPRAGLVVLDAASGEVLAIAGWPRASSTRFWESGQDGAELLPPQTRLGDPRVPAGLRKRYLSDRNFDLVEMGSATKPLWAAAALRVNPRLARDLQVKGPKNENAIFGVPIAKKGWHAEPSGWRDFPSFLAQSDNRYAVRLGFLALASTDDKGRLVPGEKTGSLTESLAGPAPSPWGRFPVFPASLGLSFAKPRILHSVHETRLASEMASLFGISVVTPAPGALATVAKKGDATSDPASFWTGREEPVNPDVRRYFHYTAPEPANLCLDQIQHSRDFVSWLLGGRQNRWSNVQFASAFTSCATGTPLVPHMVRGVPVSSTRPAFQEVAAKLRPGMASCLTSGTCRALGPQALTFVKSLEGVTAYGKTGTLAAAEPPWETSRIALTLLKPGEAQMTKVTTGLTFAVYVDGARQGMASRWLGEYLLENREAIKRILLGTK